MGVYDDIQDGKYENKKPWPKRTGSKASAALTAENTRLRHAYREEEARLTALLKSDLEKEFKVAGHPKAGKLWELAWEKGHAYGYSEVCLEYSVLAELLQ